LYNWGKSFSHFNEFLRKEFRESEQRTEKAGVEKFRKINNLQTIIDLLRDKK